MVRKNLKKEEKQKKKGCFSRIVYWCLFFIFVYFGVTALSYADTLKFAHVSDVHFSDKSVDTSYKILSHSKELLRDVVIQINQAPNIDFVIETGDLIDKPRKDFLDSAIIEMNRLKAPWYFAFGNHDAAIGTSFKKDRYFEYLKNRNKAMKSFDKFYYSFTPKKGYRVIVLDASIDYKVTATGEIQQEQLEWLDKELKKAQTNKELPLIFLHHPIQEPFPSFNHRIVNAEEVKEIINNHPIPMAIFSGHYHATKIYKENNILHVSTPSLVTYPNAFRIISITNLKNKIIFTFDFRETNLKELQKKAKLMTFSSNMLKGEQSDQNTIVILDK